MNVQSRSRRLFRKAVVVLTSRPPGCSLSKAIRDVWKGHRRGAHRKKIADQIRCLRSDESGLELWETPLGQFWAPPNGGLDFVVTELLENFYEKDAVGVRPGDVVFDCGAHVGSFSREALRRGAAHVVAVEITPQTCECLRRNFAPDIAAGRVTLVGKGLWNRDDVLELKLAGGSMGNTVITELAEQSAHDRASAIRVSVTTIDHLVEELRLEKVDFIKMDIEGAERHALAGARETLNRWQPQLAIASYHLPDDVPHIRAEVLAGNSRYEEILGPCLILHGRVAPETLFYL